MRTFARFPHFALSSLALAALAAGCSSAATSEPQGTLAGVQGSKSWAQVMSKTPAPSTGCFVASEPDTTWREVPCGEAPSAPRRIPEKLLSQFLAEQESTPSGTEPPRTPEIVGNGTDPGAQVTGTLKWAQGSFTNEVGGTSESDTNVGPTGQSATNPGSNSYSLQMNTNLFTSSACDNSTCKGWEQLIYDPLAQQAYIEFSVVGWTSTANCPATLPNTYNAGAGGSIKVCYKNTTPVTVPAVAASNLANVTMIGSTDASTNTDTVTMVIGGTSYANNQTSVLGLASGGWNYAEFNVFGEDNGTQASFGSTPTSLEVQVLTESTVSTEAAPSCPGASPSGWNTVENNTLSLVGSCCAFGGPQPGIQFMESNDGGTPPPCPALIATPNPLVVAQGECGTFTAGIPSVLSVYPQTITATSTPALPSGVLTTLGSNTAVDGAVTFSVCPTLTTPTGPYQVAITSSGPSQADGNFTTMTVDVTACTPESPTVACGSSDGYQVCGNVSLGCGQEYTCAACGSGTSCSNGLCCPPGMVGSDITCCPSGEVYYTGIGCRAPCAAGTEPCPIAGGCVTPAVCQKLNNGGGAGGNCAKTHSCS